MTNQLFDKLKLSNVKNIQDILTLDEIDSLAEEINVYKAELDAQNEELLESQQQLISFNEGYKILFEFSPIPYIVIDKNLHIIRYNTMAIRDLELNNLNLNQSIFLLFSPKEQNDFYFWMNNEEYQNNHKVFEVVINKKEKIFKSYSINRNELPNGHILLSFTDISKELEYHKKILELEKEKRNNEEIIFQKSKLESMGELLENIAHQWRQPLNMISLLGSKTQFALMNVDSIETFNTLNNEINQDIQNIIETTPFLSKTIETFRSFILKESESKMINYDISNVLNEFLLLSSDSFSKSNTKIELLNQKPTFADLNKNLFFNILFILINNSKDIFVEKNIEKGKVFIDFKEKEHYITFKVYDNGGGISQENITKVLDPYFTTKFKHQGTGIGLYMAQKIITSVFNGRINVSNYEYEIEGESNKGACFTIVIPQKQNSSLDIGEYYI